MKKEQFFEEVREILLIEREINEDTDIEIDSMASLLLIAFFDENFSKTISGEQIKKVIKTSDLIELAGENAFE